MGSQFIQFLNPFSIPIPQNYSRNSFNYNYRYSYRTNWRTNANPNKRSRFSDAFVTDDYDEPGFGKSSTKRNWWSDDFDEDVEDDEFGFFQGSIGFNWVLKVFQAFGWMIPAVIISLVLGTGLNTIIPALALPLAQSAFSLVADTFWGRSVKTSRPKSKSKRRPFARATSNNRARKPKVNGTQPRKESGDYKSWVAANNVSAENDMNSRNFGGWDELDKQVKVDNAPDVPPVKMANEPRTRERVNVSKRMKGDTPLLLRLLIATFPFLGFWTKFL